jgi:hypothetical protein
VESVSGSGVITGQPLESIPENAVEKPEPISSISGQWIPFVAWGRCCKSRNILRKTPFFPRRLAKNANINIWIITFGPLTLHSMKVGRSRVRTTVIFLERFVRNSAEKDQRKKVNRNKDLRMNTSMCLSVLNMGVPTFQQNS